MAGAFLIVFFLVGQIQLHWVASITRHIARWLRFQLFTICRQLGLIGLRVIVSHVFVFERAQTGVISNAG
jgi:hypothetical protein